MMGDLWPCGEPLGTAWCKKCRTMTPSMRGLCGHLRCAACGRCPDCEEAKMSALDDRRRWLDHLTECTQCPVNRCPKGDELAAAVREELDPGQYWEGVYRPRMSEHGPARAARERNNDAISGADRRRIAQDEAAEGPDPA